MADKCIGRLTLDTKKVDEAVKHVNEKLAELGAGVKVNISKQVASEVKKQLDSVLKEIQSYEAKMNSAVDKAIGNAASKAGKKIDNSVIKQATQDLQEYYKWLTMAEKARGSGDISGEDIYRKRAESIRSANSEMLKNAEVTKAVADAETRYQQALAKANEMVLQRQQKASEKAEAQAIKEKEQAVKDYIRALQDWYKAETDLNKELLSGNLKKGTEDYAAAREQVDQLGAKARDAGQKLTSLGVDANEATAGVRGLQQAAQALADSEDKLNSPKQEDYLAKAKQQYFELTDAIKNYNAAKKAGDETGMAAAQTRIDAAMQEVSSISQVVDKTMEEGSAKQQVLNYIQQCVTAEHQHTAEIGQSVSKTSELESQVNGLLTRYLSLMAVIRAITSLMSNMIEYVSEYSDKMNEIQMITMKTDAEVEKLAKTYRDLAADMSVSSLDMADAAIYFTRQGLGAAEIEKRLKNVTMYAKAANVEFKDASEIITAVVNSMGLMDQEAEDGREAAQRVADVFLNIGDHAATSGQEIGEAMQKAAASAGAFGVSMEWLAAYIATVSETTRQEARTIGTAFNTIIARLHQIKQTGYNSEDETKVNDIAKALSKIDVVLMDQAGNWRDMETILEEIADKWSGLDGKTRSYIATTMAGVKQQNVFLALMNDMSKKVDGNSRAFELHELAVNSDGVAMEKYGVYLDSVAASQENLTVAQEKFYSLLDEDIIKGWNNALAWIINSIADGAEAINGLNILIPVLVAGIVGVRVAITGLNAKLGETITLATMIQNHPIMMAIGAAVLVAGGLVTVISAIREGISSSAERFDEACKSIERYNANIEQATKNQESLANLQKDIEENTELSSEELSKYNGLLGSLEDISLRAKDAVLKLKNGFGDQKEQVAILNEELDKYLDNQHKLAAMEGVKKYGNYQNGNDTYEIASRMLNWSSFSDQDSFAVALQNAYNNSKWDLDEALVGYNNSVANRFMPEDLRDQITEWVKQSTIYNGDQNVEDMWKEIASVLWGAYFGGDASYDLSKYLAEEANAAIDDAMNLVGFNLDPVDFAVVRNELVKKIFGGDNELDKSEYETFHLTIANFIQEFVSNGFDPSYLNIPIEEKVVQFVSSLFSEMGDELSGAVENEIRYLFGNNNDLYETFISSMSEMLDAGFDRSDIYDLLFRTPVDQWDQALELFKAEIEDGLRDLFTTPGEGEVFDSAFADMLDGLFGEMSLKDVKSFNDIVSSLLDIDVDLDAIKDVIKASESVEELFENLRAMQENGGIIPGGDGDVVGIDTLIKNIDASIKDIKALDAAIKDLKENGENADISNLLGLAKAHPEIWTVIGDYEALISTLKKLREEASANQRDELRNLIMSTPEAMAGSRYADNGFDTLQEYRDSLTDQTEIEAFDAEVNAMIDNWQRANEDAKKVAKETKEAATDAEKSFSSAVKEVETLDKTIAKLQDNKKIDFSDIVGLSAAHPELVAFANDADKLLEMLERLKEEAKSNVKDMVKNAMLDSEDYFKESQYYNEESGIKTMREYITYLHESRGNWSAVAAEVDQAAQDIVDASDASSTAAETWLDAQMKIAEINDQVSWAKANNFEEQIRQLQEANERGGIQEAMTLFNSWDDQMQQAVGSTYPAFVLQIVKARNAISEQGEETADLTEQTKALGVALSNAQKVNDVKYFKDSAKAIKQLSDGTISATDAYDVYTKEVNKVTKAYEDILDVQNKMAYNAREVNKDNQQAIDAADVNNLASLLGVTAEEILADFPAAVDMFNELTGSAGELTDVLNMLNEAAFIRITGVADADFSKIINGLLYVENQADETVQKLLQTGQWELEARDTHGWQDVLEGNKIVNKEMNGRYWILKPTGNNPFKGRSTVASKADTKQKSSSSRSGGGGGGGSNSKTNSGPTEVEQMLDLMSQVNSIQGGQQSYYQSQQKYYSQTGRLQGVIAYMQREKEVLEEQNPVLEKNIKQIERYIAQKKAELATLSTDDEAYKEVADDLDKLQDAHQKYTKQIVDNKTALEALNQQMDEQRKKIRQMEIDLRNTILGAIEDREKKRTDMLNAEIEMENKILGIIRQRYEKERDQIIETTNLKIDALNTESSLLEEQLRIRREQAEAEDKAAKLRELEVKYQRILADPTRAKEAQNLKAEIDALRKEMAWDLSEEEVKSQQDSIDQQIESLEDYQEYIENYYEDLFEHPQKLIEEMRQIMMGTQEEIINWLKTNDEEYKNSSENTQATMVEGWTKTYNDMKGILKLYWDEVEEIIAQGDDFIIEFLKENSADYAQAGKLQAEAYVDEWKKQLSDLRKAQQQVVADIAASYATIPQYTGGSGSSGGGGGSGSSSVGGTNNTTVVASGTHGYGFIIDGKRYANKGYKTEADAANAASAIISSYFNGSKLSSSEIKQKQNEASRTLVVYKKGGLANYTGPAWLDGSESDPERILSPYQTKLFETMVTALERMATIPIDSMPNLSDVQTTGGSPMSFGDIVVNVDNLDTDDDYEELAEKVGNVLMEKIGRTAVVGGLRIRSV